MAMIVHFYIALLETLNEDIILDIIKQLLVSMKLMLEVSV